MSEQLFRKIKATQFAAQLLMSKSTTPNEDAPVNYVNVFSMRGVLRRMRRSSRRLARKSVADRAP